MLIRRAILIVLLWPLLTGAACVRMLVPPPPPTFQERMAQLQEEARLFEMMLPKAAPRDGMLEAEVRTLKDSLRELVNDFKALLKISGEHDYRLKQVEGVKK